MEFNVAHLLKEPVGTQRDYVVYSTLESPEETSGSIVQGEARLARVNQGILLNNRHELDITEAVRQSVIVALPMKPLCKEDCAGLCHYCGENLNLGCICESSEFDSRWAPLLEIAL